MTPDTELPVEDIHDHEEDLDFEHLELDVDDEGIATVEINRPKALNALNAEVLDELMTTFHVISAAENVRVVILSGAGDKAFVAGADILEMADMHPLEARDFAQMGQATLRMIEECSKPVIARIQGYALGGGLELALACHLRVASKKAMLGLPEVGLGLIPGFAGSQRMIRLTGAGIAREWILTGDPVSAEEAYRVGVVNRLTEPEELDAVTMKLARKIASRGPVAVQLAMNVLRRGFESGQTEAEQTEADAFGLVFSTEDMREGTKAFQEKRKPDFKGL